MEDLKKKEEKKSENIIVLEKEEKDLNEEDFSWEEEELNQYFKTFSLFKKEQNKEVRRKRKERREAIVSNLVPSVNTNNNSSLGDRVTSVKQELAGDLSKSVVSKTIIPVLDRKPEDVSRKNEKGKSTSKDRKYKNDVINATNKVLKEVGQALRNGGSDPKVRKAQVEKLLNHRKVLVLKHTHYGDLEAVKKKKLKENEEIALIKQRELKCEGIQKRMNEIDLVIRGIDQIDDRAEDEMVHSVSSSMNELSKIKDDKEREKQAKPLASVLDSNTEPTVTYSISGKKTDDEETLKRKKVESQFKQKVLARSRDNKSLISVLNQVNTNNQSSVVKELLEVHGKDTARMDDLCEKAFAEELKESNKEGDYLRKDSLATKLFPGQYHRNCPNGKKYLATSLNGSKDQIRKSQKEDLEIDPNKVKEEDKEKIPKRKEALKNLTIGTVKSITETPPPPEMSKVCTQIYDDYMEKFNDERGALVKVGGHLLLRCVNPELTDAVKNPDPNASDEEKNMQKTTTLLTKVLQNISNQVSFGVKEKHLDDFNELVGTTEEEDDGTNTGKTKKVFKPGPLTKMMQEYFKQVVEEGRKAKKDNLEEKEEKKDESNNNATTTTTTTWTSGKKKKEEERNELEMSEEELKKLKEQFGKRQQGKNVKIELSKRESSSLEEETVLPSKDLQELEQAVQYGDYHRAHGIMVKVLNLDASLSGEVVGFWEKVAGLYMKKIQPDEELCDHLTKLVNKLPGEVSSIFVTHVLSYLTKSSFERGDWPAMSIVVRLRYLADHPEVVDELADWAFLQWFRGAGLTWDDAFERMQERQRRDDLPLALVALEGRRPAGTVSLLRSDAPGAGAAACLTGLYVAPRWRGRGIGRRLCRRALAEARRLGRDRLALYTTDHEPYYARLGWSTRSVAIVETGSRLQVAAFMERPVTGRPPSARS